MTRFVVIAAAGWLFAAPAASAAASNVPTSTSAAIHQLIAAYQRNGDFHGTLLVADHKRIIAVESVGEADRTWHVANTLHTRFRIASMTKSFTAAIALQLVNQGKLQLDAPIGRYLPDYRKDTGAVVTVDELLSHRSGLPDFENDEFYQGGAAALHYDRAEFIRRFLSGTPEFPPGTKAKYSNTGYWLLGPIIENASGKSYAQNLDAGILRPLGLSETGIASDGRIVAQLATGYVDSYTYSREAPYVNMDNFLSDGGLYSSAPDLLRWIRALDDGVALPPVSRDKLYFPYAADYYQPELSYGYGWEVGRWEIASGLVVDVREHGGNTPGFRDMMTELPGRGYIIIVLQNTGDGQFDESPQAITKGIAAILYGRTPAAPPKSLEREMGRLVATGRKDDAVALYARAHAAPGYHTNDFTLVKFCDELIAMNDANTAVEILDTAALNDHKSSSRILNELGDAFSALGKRADAIRSYRDALAANPQSTKAQRRLRELGADHG